MSLRDVSETASQEEIDVADKRARLWVPKTKRKHPIKIEIGVGFGTGPCLVGNLGSLQHFDYSVRGDSANLASRLKGQT